MIFRLRLQAEVLGLKYIIEVSEGTRGGYKEQDVGRRMHVRSIWKSYHYAEQVLIRSEVLTSFRSAQLSFAVVPKLPQSSGAFGDELMQATIFRSVGLSMSALVGNPDPDPWVFRAPGALPRSVKICSHG